MRLIAADSSSCSLRGVTFLEKSPSATAMLTRVISLKASITRFKLRFINPISSLVRVSSCSSPLRCLPEAMRSAAAAALRRRRVEEVVINNNRDITMIRPVIAIPKDSLTSFQIRAVISFSDLRITTSQSPVGMNSEA